jgi:hypothetical protein
MARQRCQYTTGRRSRFDVVSMHPRQRLSGPSSAASRGGSFPRTAAAPMPSLPYPHLPWDLASMLPFHSSPPPLPPPPLPRRSPLHQAGRPLIEADAMVTRCPGGQKSLARSTRGKCSDKPPTSFPGSPVGASCARGRQGSDKRLLNLCAGKHPPVRRQKKAPRSPWPALQRGEALPAGRRPPLGPQPNPCLSLLSDPSSFLLGLSPIGGVFVSHTPLSSRLFNKPSACATNTH